MLAERYDASALLLVHRLVCKTACCKALLLPGEAKTIENGKHVLSSQRRTADGACTKRKPRAQLATFYVSLWATYSFSDLPREAIRCNSTPFPT